MIRSRPENSPTQSATPPNPEISVTAKKKKKKRENLPPLILRRIKNIRKRPQNAQWEFQDRRQLWPRAGDGESEFVDGEID